MQRPRASGWQPGQPRPRRMPPVVAESLGVLFAVTLLIMGAGAVIGYVIVNHSPAKGPGPVQQAQQAQPPGVQGNGNGQGGGAGGGGATTSAGTTTSAATTTAAATTSGATTAQAPGGGSALAAGKKVFETAGCTGCHTLKDANATGTVGPNLDQIKPPEPVVEKQVINGGGGMPPFKGSLSPQQIKAVSQYVAAVAGKG